MCLKINRFANTGIVNISTANPNLNGTGVLGTVLQSPLTSNGTKVSTITVKATGNTSQGMIRLFTFDGINYHLFNEVIIPATTQSSVVPAFQTMIFPDLNLKPGDTLFVSTQNAESFNVHANGIDWQNCSCSDTGACSEIQSDYNTGIVTVSVANSALNGTGSIGTLVTSPVVANAYGTVVNIVNIKAMQSTTMGMVRFSIDNGVNKFLIWEITIPAITISSVEPTYRTEYGAFIDLSPSYSLCVSTQNAESFNILTFASNLINCPC